MNAKQAKQISLISILKQLNTKKYKDTGRDIWYFSPFRNEKTASFKVNRWKNIFYDFGEGKGGNVIDFIMLYFHCEFTEALHIIRDRFNSFSFHQQSTIKSCAVERKKENWKIRKVKSIEHPALLSYLRKRGVYEQKNHLKEIHYTVNKKFYFGIGFQNDSGGWEIRNKYSKICLGEKNISIVRNGKSILRIFEGFFDYLSFHQIKNCLEFDDSDYLILNSVSLINRLDTGLENYNKIELFLDNDEAGNEATKKLQLIYKNVDDNRLLYRSFKDLNDYLISGKKK